MDEANRLSREVLPRMLCFCLVLLALLAAILAWRINRPIPCLEAQVAEANAAMSAISLACQDYFADTLELPRPNQPTRGAEADTIWNYQCLRENVFSVRGWRGPYLVLDDWPLDPWGTPYGIGVLPDDTVCYVIVVSFGPNQKRDAPAETDPFGRYAGDDLVIIGRVTMISPQPAPAPSPPPDPRSIAGRFASEPSGLLFLKEGFTFRATLVACVIES